jgi:hypothetical protein
LIADATPGVVEGGHTITFVVQVKLEDSAGGLPFTSPFQKLGTQRFAAAAPLTDNASAAKAARDAHDIRDSFISSLPDSPQANPAIVQIQAVGGRDHQLSSGARSR